MTIARDVLLADARRAADARDAGRMRRYVTTLVGGLTPVQRALALDQARRIAVIAPRRTGKTTGITARFVRRLLLQRKANCLYIALTRQNAEELMWAPLKDLNQRLSLGATFNNTALRMVIPGLASEITLSGADNQADIEKHRGQAYDEVWIDECKSFKAKLLEELIVQVLSPALMDRRGVLGMIGTPGAILQGPFYEATRAGSLISKPHREADTQRDWAFHRWTLRDNTAMPGMWDEALLEKERHGWSDENPIWRREYLGEWVADDTDRVYKFREHDEQGAEWNVWTPAPKTEENPFGLPEGHWWRYVYGIDLGSKDPFALQVLAYSETSPLLYQVAEHTQRGMTVTQVGELVMRMIESTGYPEAIVADLAGSGGMIIAELNERFGLSIEPAEKKNKPDAIELANSDLLDGRLKLLRDSQAAQQMGELQWDETGMRENKAQRNDACDALIYARRKAMHHHSSEPERLDPSVAALRPDARKQLEDEAAEIERMRRRSSNDYDWEAPADL